MFEDHLAALEADSAKVGTQGGDLDFALLLDGLTAEREQGITIDVAYRFFSTERRKFIVADTPGHEQYTRNMVTGRLDRRRRGDPRRRPQGHAHPDPSPQLPRVAARHQAGRGGDQQDGPRRLLARTCSATIAEEYLEFAGRIGLDDVTFIPMSALRGDNIIEPSANTPWYHGPTLLGYLETVPVDDEVADGPFRMPVQWVNRPNLDFRGFSGRIVGGTIRPGDPIRVLPSGHDQHRRADRHDGRRPRRGDRRSVGHAHARRRDRRQPRRRHLRRRRRPPRSPTSSRPTSCGCTRTPCCPGGRT